jgi:RNA polymerase sigma factor (sigma-70 family)
MTTKPYQLRNYNTTALTREREMLLAKRWRNRRYKPARDELVKNYIVFSVKLARKFFSGSVPEDDIHRIANIALLTAINKFNPERTKVGRIATFLYVYLLQAHKEYWRDRNVVKMPASKRTPNRFCSLDATPDIIPDPSESMVVLPPEPGGEELKGEQLAKLKEAMKKLPPKYRRVLHLVYFEGRKLADAARRLNPPITREAARQQRNKALNMLRAELASHPIFQDEDFGA